jgi:AraC family transcriptional activator of pobA
MSGLPGFLRGAAAAPIQTVAGPVRAGSFGLIAQGTSWRYTLLHDRPADFLLLMTRGQGRAVIEGVRRGLSTHQALFVPAGTLFSLDLPTGTQALFVESPAGLTDRLPDTPLLMRVRDSMAQAELTAEIDAMAREIAGHRPRALEALEARVRLVSVWLHRQVAAGTVEPGADGASQRLARRFARIVVRAYRSPAPMAEHAEALDVTPTHLTRVCKQSCGRTAADMLSERRLHAARMALETGTQPVQAIAQNLGFASAAYFSRFVQVQTGQSPTALRKAARKRA